MYVTNVKWLLLNNKMGNTKIVKIYTIAINRMTEKWEKKRNLYLRY